MTGERIAIKIIPTPATQDISQRDLFRLARITKLPSERIKERISSGKGLVIITAMHPRIEDLVSLIRAIGFSVTTGPADAINRPVSPKTTQTTPRVLDSEWKIGSIIENLYEVKDIKQGGMGAVYLVRHRRWNTMMAVKSLLHRLRENEEDRALFVKEAETWIDIGFHPNIAACYYVRNIDDSPRIFIEYVDGGGLHEWLVRRRPAGWDVIIDCMVQASDGLEHAHSKGLVHRDIKPANCMMTRDGVLKVTDFGLTKKKSQELSAAEIEADGPAPDRESITAAGMGTPGYMAPEMWIPHTEVGPPADMYAFGVMFFELCCGRKPFVLKAGEKREKLALAHVKQAPPRPSTYRRDIPPALEEVILKCLNKNPDNRYPSFRVIREDLAGIYESLFQRRFPRETPDELRLLSDALNNRAVSLMDLNHQEEAERALLKALESDPHHPEAVYNLGLLRWLRMSNPDRELVVRMEEVIKTPEYVGRGASLLGRCLLTLGDAERALKACELSLTAEEATESWLKPYAIALIGTGCETDAIARLETYSEEFPNDDEAAGWLIGALTRTGRNDEAQALMRALPASSEIRHWTQEKIAENFFFSGLSEVLSMEGHAGWITCVLQSPKSGAILTGSRDRTIRFWNPETGATMKTVSVVGEPPAILWISPDERYLAIAASQTGVPVKILHVDSGKFVGSLPGHEGAVTALGFSPDGRHILTAEQKGSARLWSATDFKFVSAHKIPVHTAAAIYFDEHSRPGIFLAGMDRVLKKIFPPDSPPQAFEKVHRDPITAVKVSPSGGRVLTCGREKQVLVWDGEAGGVVSGFQAHQEHVAEVALNPVRDLAASYDPKSGIKVWDSRNGMVLRTFSPGDGEITCMAFTINGERLLAGGRDMTLKIWDVRGRPMTPNLALAKIRPVKKQMKSDRKFKAMIEAAKKAMKRGAFGTAYSMLRDSQTLQGYERSDVALDLIFRLKDYGKRTGIHGGWKRKSVETQCGVLKVVFSPSAIAFLTAQADHTVRMWSTKTGDCLKVLKGHTNLVSTVSFSGTGREAASTSDDRSVRTWDLNSGRNLLTLKGHGENVSAVAYSPDATALVSGSWDKTLRLWRLPDGYPMRTLKGHEDKITCANFVHNGEHIVSAGFDGVVKMWETSSGRLLRDLRGHKDKIMCLDVSKQGDLLLTGSMDGTARIWDTKTGSCMKVIDVNESGVRATGFSPDQAFVVTGGSDSVLRIWSLSTGKCLREFQGHLREITSAEFSSNGRFVISSSADGSIIIWEVDWEWKFSGIADTKS
ncbi:MAG TPA: protein kinase [Desulfomonilaceae bacterium]|nr:protein kinase [Desulfomonilaceae bacterium]